MGIFSFFSKEKKETLDKGLEKWTMMYWIVWRRSW